MVVEPPAKRGVSGDLCVPDTQVGVGRVVSEAVLARATLDQRNSLTAKALISEQRCGSCLSAVTT